MNSMRQSNSDLTPGEELLGKSLGWFGIGLGLAEILAPGPLAKLIGVRSNPPLFIALGMREIVSGIGILSQRRPTGWLWSRVAGDVMDLSLLGAALASPRSDKARVEAAAMAVLAAGATDLVSALQHSRGAEPVRFTTSILIDRPPEAVFRFWRRLENHPRFMGHIESVQTYGTNRSHWVARAGGKRMEWEAETTAEIEDRFLSWSSLPGADLQHSGSVWFEHAPGERGTLVRVDFSYQPPGGLIGRGISKLFGFSPERQMHGDLERLKRLLEGETVTPEERVARTSVEA